MGKRPVTVAQHPMCRRPIPSPSGVRGHPVHDTLPVHKRAFIPEWQCSVKEADERAATIHHRLEDMYNRTAHDLPQLAVGTKVAVQDHRTRKWDKCGTIVKVGRNRDYMIRLTSGRVWWRNRRFLHRCYPVATPDPPNPVPNPVMQPLAHVPKPHEHPPTAASSSPTPCKHFSWHAPAPH